MSGVWGLVKKKKAILEVAFLFFNLVFLWQIDNME